MYGAAIPSQTQNYRQLYGETHILRIKKCTAIQNQKQEKCTAVHRILKLKKQTAVEIRLKGN